MISKVTCAKCGFVAQRDKQTRELVEIERQTREFGTRTITSIDPQFFGGSLGPEPVRVREFETIPICFVRAHDLTLDYNQCKGHETKRVQAIMQKERDCESFAEWQQGYSPREHREMLLEREQLEWQAQQARESRDFQANQLALAEQRHRRNERSNWMRLVAGLILGSILTILTAYFASNPTTPEPADNEPPATQSSQ